MLTKSLASKGVPQIVADMAIALGIEWGKDEVHHGFVSPRETQTPLKLISALASFDGVSEAHAARVVGRSIDIGYCAAVFSLNQAQGWEKGVSLDAELDALVNSVASLCSQRVA